MIFLDFHHLGAFFVRNYRIFHHAPPPPFEGATMDSKLENVGPMLYA